MRKQTLLVLICIGVAILTSINPCRAASETTDSNPEISCSPVSIPAPPSSRVGSFIGVSGDALILAGGKNLDGNSTDVVDLLPLNGSLPRNWRTFHLHEKLAWGASVVAGDSLICIGGEGDNGCEKSVIRLCWRDGKLVEDQLADLPQARAWAGAAMLDGVIYVAGGVTNSHAAAASNDLLSLDITDPQARWKRQEPLPGAPRVQPAVIGQYYGLEVFGGRTAHTDSSGQQIWDTLSDCWVYRPKPLDFTTKQGWIRLADLPAPLAGGAAVASGQAHTILLVRMHSCTSPIWRPPGKPRSVIFPFSPITPSPIPGAAKERRTHTAPARPRLPGTISNGSSARSGREIRFSNCPCIRIPRCCISSITP